MSLLLLFDINVGHLALNMVSPWSDWYNCRIMPQADRLSKKNEQLAERRCFEGNWNLEDNLSTKTTKGLILQHISHKRVFFFLPLWLTTTTCLPEQYSLLSKVQYSCFLPSDNCYVLRSNTSCNTKLLHTLTSNTSCDTKLDIIRFVYLKHLWLISATNI